MVTSLKILEYQNQSFFFEMELLINYLYEDGWRETLAMPCKMVLELWLAKGYFLCAKTKE